MADISPKALVIGAAMVDIACYVDRLPLSGEGVVPRSVTKTVGGCALNSAAMLQHLGVKPILFAPVGEGLFSTMVKDTAASLGLTVFEPYVNGSRVPSLCMPSAGFASDQPVNSASPYDCGACICLVEPDGERTMITIPGIERHFTASWFSVLSEAELANVRAVIVCGYELETPGGDDILDFLEAHPAIQVFYAPGPRVCAVPPKRVERLHALHAIWHLNDQETCAYTGEEDLEQAGSKLTQEINAPVIITAGEKGSYLFAPQSASAPDTIGVHGVTETCGTRGTRESAAESSAADVTHNAVTDASHAAAVKGADQGLSRKPAPDFAPALAPNLAPNLTPALTSDLASGLAPALAPDFAPDLAPNRASDLAPGFAPNLAPGFAPALAPNLAPDLAPDLTPALTSDLAPGFAPGFAPALAPALAPSLTPALAPALAPALTPTLATPVEVLFVPSTPVCPVNTVGAGDAHLGAVVAGWIQGMTWQDTLARANKAAAEICLIEGTVPARY